MNKEKRYRNTRFSENTLKEAIAVFRSRMSGNTRVDSLALRVHVDGATWGHDSEIEFYSDYRRSTGGFFFLEVHSAPKGKLHLQGSESTTFIDVEDARREDIEKVFAVFEASAAAARLPEPPAIQPAIFIGHGRNGQWRDLKDHLGDKHGYRMTAYEVGARAGHTIRDIVTGMLNKSNFALLLLTADDEMKDGAFRARQNVVHEVGLFQGRLGFHRAIVLLEEGVEEFSNISGIEQIRFGTGRIRETFGEILATLRREFGECR